MNLGMPEMIFICLLALVVVGPKRLPGLARQMGKWVAEFKRASNDFKNQLETEMMNIELDERAKKQTEAAEALPSEKSWEATILPPVGIVSRGQTIARVGPADGKMGRRVQTRQQRVQEPTRNRDDEY